MLLSQLSLVISSCDDDCPPLAYASDLHSATGVHSGTAAESAPIATVTFKDNSSTSRNSLGHTGNTAAQKQSLQQQQPCVQCGKLTKKRCRRCQAVYYCSEECHVKCFKDPEHRAECDAAAAVLALQVAC
jgi:MYND finger